MGLHALTGTSATSTAKPAPAGAVKREHKSSGSSEPVTAIGHDLSKLPSFISPLVPLPVPDWSKPIILGLILICLALAFRAWLSGHRARKLETQRRELAADLDSIQAALIPAIPANLGALGVSVAYRPAEGPGAGGDFYDAFALDGARVAIIVGDVSGHGREALGRAAHMHYTLRAYVEMGLEPRAALKLAGHVLGFSEDDLFTTVVVAVHDAAAGTLTYASAGHPAPALAGPGEHEPLIGSASPPLGWGVPTGRRQTTVPFPKGSRALFFTDGVTEARVGNELLGRERLAEIFADIEPDAGAPELLESVRRHATATTDDMAACVVQATQGAAVSEHRVEEFELDPRQLASGQGERFFAGCGVYPADGRPALARAEAIASELGTALLRVEVTDAGAIPGASGPVPVTLGAGAPLGAPAAGRESELAAA